MLLSWSRDHGMVWIEETGCFLFPGIMYCAWADPAEKMSIETRFVSFLSGELACTACWIYVLATVPSLDQESIYDERHLVPWLRTFVSTSGVFAMLSITLTQ